MTFFDDISKGICIRCKAKMLWGRKMVDWQCIKCDMYYEFNYDGNEHSYKTTLNNKKE